MNKKICLGVTLGLITVQCGVCFGSERLEDGRRAYVAVCASCHDKGINGAPITGRTEDWSGRSRLWEAVLFKHANRGYLDMPAKGGRPELSDYEVDAAAEYMLTVSFPNLPED